MGDIHRVALTPGPSPSGRGAGGEGKHITHIASPPFSEDRNAVYLGADVYPGENVDANSRMSMLACLAHELAHAERYELGFQRPITMPEVLIDEAETSLHASFMTILSVKDRADLIEDARDRLIQWLATQSIRGTQ